MRIEVLKGVFIEIDWTTNSLRRDLLLTLDRGQKAVKLLLR
jgi:hypothetical protein